MRNTACLARERKALCEATSQTPEEYTFSQERLPASTLFEHLVLSQISILGQGTALDRLG